MLLRVLVTCIPLLFLSNHNVVLRRIINADHFMCSNTSSMRYFHASILWLITLIDWPRDQSSIDLVVSLDDLATLAPKGRTTVAATVSWNSETFSYLCALHHTEYPAAEKKCEASMDDAVTIEEFWGWVGRISQPCRRTADN